MALVLYDTLRRAKAPFEAREPGVAAMYVCGPTVYGDAHVGHGRATVVFDVLRRWLRHSGYETRYVVNITDVDDKIIRRARAEDVSPFVLAERYTRAWNRATDALGVEPPDVQPRATGHIIEMQELISQLVADDAAYETGGNVLFRVRRFERYGQLSNRSLDDLQQGDDVPGVTKDDPLDFALWKAAKEGEPAWPSPWGPGRPGWHIECSAMAAKHLGHGFDVHGGGLDLVFPHHENEIAQHEAAHGAPFARFWLHNGMLRMGEEKMARSVGNIVSIEEAVQRWGQGPLRLWYCGAHYRSPLTFDESRLDEGAAAHDRLTTFLRNARVVSAGVEPDTAGDGEFVAAFTGAMDDDVNTPQALAALFDLVAAGNELILKAEDGDAASQATLARMAKVLVDLGDGVLGLDLDATVAGCDAVAERIAPLVDDLLAQRSRAREERDFAAADAIRDRLSGIGVVVEDRPNGARWYVERGLREA